MLLVASSFGRVSVAATPQAGLPAFDIVIRSGRIVDGTGSPWFSADLGIRDGRIAAIGRLADAPARRVIDARGMVVAPGFIDMMGQSELTILVNPHLPSKVFQGITTEITGEGGSAAPLSDDLVRRDKLLYEQLGIEPTWRSFHDYFARLETQGIGINFASYVGATQVRRMVLGESQRPPSPQELERMRGLVREAMHHGAAGLSTLLELVPGSYASTEEVLSLAREAGQLGGVYATHLRSEGVAVLAAIDEAARVGREAALPVEIFHLKAGGKANWGRMPEMVAEIERARHAGVDIAADTYAYTAWMDDLKEFMPPWALEGGRAALLERLRDRRIRERIRTEMNKPAPDWYSQWQDVPDAGAVRVATVRNPRLLPLQGKSIAEIAEQRHEDPIDTIFDLLADDEAFTQVTVFAMAEPDVALAVEQPWVSACTDAAGTSPEGRLGREHPHPRAYGAFTHILRKYVREEKRLRLEDAIRKFTALPAQRMRLGDRGVLKVGLWADVVVFDPGAVADVATFDSPNRLSEGMRFVLVNGVPVVDDGRATEALPGKVLRGPGQRRPR